jgi:hypothetical protein
MKKQLRSLALSASSLLAVLCMTTTAVAAPSAALASRLQGDSPQPGSSSNANSSTNSKSNAAATKCTKMTPTDVYWVTLADDGSIDQKVDSYPSGATKVVSAFDYDCIPAKTKLNIVWSIDGEQVLTDNNTPKPSTAPDTFTYSLFMKDNSALADGQYAVEFYIGQNLITSGTVTVGDTVTSTTDVSTTTTTTSDVAVQGTVTDSKSKKPITGALVVVLNAGVDITQWLKNGQDSDVFAFAKTDSKGQFELNNRIPTATPLPWIIGAKGYQVISQKDYSIDQDADDPYVMNIALDRAK